MESLDSDEGDFLKIKHDLIQWEVMSGQYAGSVWRPFSEEAKMHLEQRGFDTSFSESINYLRCVDRSELSSLAEDVDDIFVKVLKSPPDFEVVVEFFDGLDEG